MGNSYPSGTDSCADWGKKMAEITLERKGELLRKVFEILLDHPDGLRAGAVIALLVETMELSEFERGSYPDTPNRLRVDKIVRFTTINFTKAGWLRKEKGTWTLTDAGRKAYESYGDPHQFESEAEKLYRKWKRGRPHDPAGGNGPEPDTTTTLEEAEESAWNEIEVYLKAMPPYDFQNLVAALLRAMGYHVDWVSPPGPDGGLDIVAYNDPLGTKPPRIKVQVRRREARTSVEDVRAFMSLLALNDVGIFVSTGGFTGSAEEEARKQETRRVTLIGLQRLFDLWVEHYQKLEEADKQLLPLKPVYFLMPEE